MGNVFIDRKAPLEGRDFYPTPPWATRALFEHGFAPYGIVWEPADGGGHMSRVIEEYTPYVLKTDIITGYDFLKDEPLEADWIITNPPFNIGTEFALRALEVTERGVALFVRYGFLESKKRYNLLFKDHKPAKIYQFTERVGLLPDRVSRTAPAAVAYCWIIWDKQHVGPTEFEWIGPVKDKLERDEDYDD